MRRLYKLLATFLVCVIGASASAQITVTFTGRDSTDQYHIPLHHVDVFNLDQLWEEVLYYPDTTLLLGSVGFDDHELLAGFELMQNVPNPFDGTTEFALVLPQGRDIFLEIYDITGKLAVGKQFSALPAGTHLFQATLTSPQTYILSAKVDNGQMTIKMVNEGHGADNTIRYLGMSDANGDFTLYLKDDKAASGYPFSLGDEMKYIGYAEIEDAIHKSKIILRNQNASETIHLKFDVSAPIVNTIVSNTITSTTATCGVQVEDDGGTTITALGICWNTSPNPMINNDTMCGLMNTITGLSPNTTYHVRAYATNSVGTAYGEDKTFTTLCDEVNMSATGTTTIYYGQTATLFASGASSYLWSTGDTEASITVNPLSTTTYTVTGTNSYGCTATASVTVTVNFIEPTVVTDMISAITSTTANCGGNVISDGGAAVTERGVCWSTSQNPTVNGNHHSMGNGLGSFGDIITGLAPNTTYYVRAYATNSVGTAYGDTVSFKTNCDTVIVNIVGNTTVEYGGFTTLTATGASSYHWSTNANDPSITVFPTSTTTYTVTGTNSYGCTDTASVTVTVNYLSPTVITSAVSNITPFTATCGGYVTSDGGQPVTAQGICWSSTHQNPTIDDSQYIFCDTNATVFSGGITGLTPNTTYYVRAFAINAVNINYGDVLSFNTLCDDEDTTLFVTACDSYVWNGVTYVVSGEFVRTFTKPNGCDSTVTLHLTISNSDTVAVDTVVCDSCLPLVWKSVTFMEAGTQFVSLWNIYGCDSVVMMTLHVVVIDSKSCTAAPTVTDHEGNVYATVQIGNQCWMRENLRTTTSPSTGTYIVNNEFTSGTNVACTYTGKMARWYNNDSATYAPMNYGLLYNWNAAVDTFNTAYGETSVNDSSSRAVSVSFSGHRRGICPAGWHLPSDAEWTQLTDYVSSQSGYVCGDTNINISKTLAATTGWSSTTNYCAVGNDRSTNNATGFGALPAGYYGGRFLDDGIYSNFWSYTRYDDYRAYDRYLHYDNARVGRFGSTKYYGFSVRCLRDAGTAVVDEKSCTAAPTVTDHEGNVYATVQIGNQCWIRDNLRTTTSPSTGTYIVNNQFTSGTNIDYTYTGKMARWYNNDSATYAPMNYGLLYNWNAAVDTFNTTYGETSINDSSSRAVSVIFSGHRRGICPAGWHLPSDAEWTQLTNYVSGQSEYICGDTNINIAKALAATTCWDFSTNYCDVGNDRSANNITGFSAVPAGLCYVSSFLVSSFLKAGRSAYFWSSSQIASYPVNAYYRYLYYDLEGLFRSNDYKSEGFSVRCLRDAGTAVVDEKSCTAAPTVTDHEGNVYATVQIGNQCWMRDNLRTTTSPSTGTYIVNNEFTPGTYIAYTYTGKMARWYNNDSATYAPMNYGLLYNWNAAVDTFNTLYGETSVNDSSSRAVSVSFSGHRRGICPAGWHLPSDAEWTQLTNYVSNQSEYVCGDTNINIAKALAAITGWYSYTNYCAVGNDRSTNNTTGFSAVPAGYCPGSLFYDVGLNASFWSSSQDGSNRAYRRYLNYNNAGVGRNDGSLKINGRSVRCLRDAGTAVVDEKSCPDAPTVTDHEGNVYATVQIGNQCWIRDNLRTTTSPSTGTYIVNNQFTSGTNIDYTYTGKMARWYNNDSATYAPMNYGLLYNWNAAVDMFNTTYGETSINDSSSRAVSVIFSGHRRGICPAGWHLPSDEEWTQLTNYVSSQNEYVCGDTNINIAKALAATTGWYGSTDYCAVGNDPSANNVTGFSAVPAGRCTGPSFYNAGNMAYFWSSSQQEFFPNEAYYRYLSYGYAGVYRGRDCKYTGRSVRCLRDAGIAVIDSKSCTAAPTVTDHEGNVYATVQIGNQCWIRDNLRTTTSPSTGTYIVNNQFTSGTNVDYTYTGKMARWYNNDSATYAPMNYGLLYNWNAAVDTFNTTYGETSINDSSSRAVSVIFSGHRRGICPAGWHLPSDEEWTQLTNYVSSQNEYVCGDTNINIAKALAATTGWYGSTHYCAVGNDPSANNVTGFSAVPAGRCSGAWFHMAGYSAYFWSSSQNAFFPYEAYYRYLYHGYAGVYRNRDRKYTEFSVRCLRDAGTTVVDEKSCTAAPTVTDHEGNVYATVQIGNQCWMRDNLRTTTSPSTGTYLIPSASTGDTYTGKQAHWYNNDSATYAPMNYGLLYNWNAAVDTFNTAYGETSVIDSISRVVSVSFSGHRRGICPVGWHLPSDAEWNIMERTVSGSDWQAGYETTYDYRGSHAGKLAGGINWRSNTTSSAPGHYNNADRNVSGFSAVPAGHCYGVSFDGAGNTALFWSSSQYSSGRAYYRGMNSNLAGVGRNDSNGSVGFSVRCLRD